MSSPATLRLMGLLTMVGLCLTMSPVHASDEETDPRDAPWDVVHEAMARLEVYRGLRLTPQERLVPLGMDARSGLLEFAVEGTGKLPTRAADSQTLVRPSGFAIILILVPGGNFLMGAQSEDPKAPGFNALANYLEPPPHKVTLSPFFISKYECTRSQWRTLGGEASSGDEMNLPIGQITWEACVGHLQRFGLTLPTEAQWEYSCRAGTSTPWWCGDDPKGLESTDWFESNSGQGIPRPFHPVGEKRANPFGLHDVHGNVAEWCADCLRPYGKEDLVDPFTECREGMPHVLRGGFSGSSAADSRSTGRGGFHSGVCSHSLGFRPARAIERDSESDAPGSEQAR